MDNVKLSSLDYEELLKLNDVINEMISFLDKEIQENTEE